MQPCLEAQRSLTVATPPKAPRLQFAPSPMFDEPMEEFQLPEAAKSDDDFLPAFDMEFFMNLPDCDDMSIDEKANIAGVGNMSINYKAADDDCQGFNRGRHARGFSNASTALPGSRSGSEDLDDCSSPCSVGSWRAVGAA